MGLPQYAACGETPKSLEARLRSSIPLSLAQCTLRVMQGELRCHVDHAKKHRLALGGNIDHYPPPINRF